MAWLQRWNIVFFNITKVPNEDWTLLHWACWSNDLNVVKKLLQSPHIDINKEDSAGDTAFAIAYSLRRKEIVKFFLEKEKNLDLTKKRRDGRTPLMYVCEQGLSNLVKLFLKRCDPNITNREQQTAFYLACAKQRVETVKVMLAYKPDKLAPKLEPNKPDKLGKTPFIVACEKGSVGIVQLLAEDPRVELDQKDKTGHSGFVHACINNRLEVVKYLLTCPRLDLNSSGEDGVTALHIICCWKKDEMIKVKGDVIKLILESGRVQINDQDKTGKNALMYACQVGNDEIAKMLLTEPKFLINDKDRQGKTGFYHACQEENLNLVRILLKDERVNINIVDNQKTSPLMIACKTKRTKIVNALLNDQRTDINLSDVEGRTAFHWACEMGEINTIKLMLQDERIDILKEDDQGRSPILTLVQQHHRIDLLDAFLNHGRIVDIRKVLTYAQQLRDPQFYNLLQSYSERKKNLETFGFDESYSITKIKNHGTINSQPRAENVIVVEGLLSSLKSQRAAQKGQESETMLLNILNQIWELTRADNPATKAILINGGIASLLVGIVHEEIRMETLLPTGSLKEANQAKSLALRAIKNLILNEDNYKYEFIKCGILPALKVVLDSPHDDEKFFGVNILGNLASVNEICLDISSHGFGLELIKIFNNSPTHEILLTTLINIASHKDTKAKLIQNKILPPIVLHFQRTLRIRVLLFVLTLGNEEALSKIHQEPNLMKQLCNFREKAPKDMFGFFCLINISKNGEHDKALVGNDVLMRSIKQLLESEVNSPNMRSVYSIQQLLGTVERISNIKGNQKLLIDEKIVLPLRLILFPKKITEETPQNQLSCLSILSQLALDTQSHHNILDDLPIEAIQKLTQISTPAVAKQAHSLFLQLQPASRTHTRKPDSFQYPDSPTTPTLPTSLLSISTPTSSSNRTSNSNFLPPPINLPPPITSSTTTTTTTQSLGSRRLPPPPGAFNLPPPLN